MRRRIALPQHPLLPSKAGTLDRRTVLGAAAAASLPFPAWAASAVALAPFGATPSARQLAWQRTEANAFVHFTVDTFTDREWGFGDESPSVFNPTDFSADQIVGAAKSAHLHGVILTCKHHDGFCLWPSAYTEHSIKNSPYKGGKGDIVGEMAAACRRAGLKFGVYLSPWDRNRADYGTPHYVEVYRAQLTELLTRYGPIFDVWFDQANGGNGYYGGARETRHIDSDTYYDWPTMLALVRRLQPDAVTFGPPGMDTRWVGNEEGVADDPCWATMKAAGPYSQADDSSGLRGGPVYWPAEADVSLRPGWFWHGDEDDGTKSPAQLERLYFVSVGRGTNLLLNLPPDRRGRIPDRDAASLATWGEAMAQMRAQNFADGAHAAASSVRGAGFEPARVLDDDPDSYWACADGAAAPTLTLELDGPQTFDVVRLREYLPMGLRVTRFALDIRAAEGWREIFTHEGIGAQRLVRLDAPVTTQALRLRILDAPAGPAISEISLFRAPRLLDAPAIVRDRLGQVSISADKGQAIHVTVDGPTPTPSSPRYTAPFGLPEGGTVQAIAINAQSGAVSPLARRTFDLAKADWRIVRASAPGAQALIDEDNHTVWTAPAGTPSAPCEVVIDLGSVQSLKGFTLLPPQNRLGFRKADIGVPGAYEAYVGDLEAARGEFSNIASSLSPQRIVFATPVSGRDLRLVFLRATGGEPQLSVAEVGVITR